MKKSLLFMVLFINIFILNSQTSKEPKFHFRIGTDAPENSYWVIAMNDIDKEIRKATNEEVGITVYAGGTMGDQSGIIKKIQLGQLSGAGLSSGGCQLIYKDFGILGFPMLFKSIEEYDYIIEKMGSFFEQKFEENNFILIAWTEVGLLYLFSKKPVTSIELLRASKPYIMEGDIISQALYREANITPIPTKLSDVLTDLNTGRVETIFSSTYGLIAMQWHYKVNYMADFPITIMIGTIVLEKKLFNSMPKNYQELLRNLFKQYFDKVKEKVRKDNETARVVLQKKSGIKILPVEQSQKDKFYEICEKTSLKLTEKEFSKDLYIKILDILTQYRKNK